MDIDLGQSKARMLGLLLAHGSRALGRTRLLLRLAYLDFFFCYELPTPESVLDLLTLVACNPPNYFPPNFMLQQQRSRMAHRQLPASEAIESGLARLISAAPTYFHGNFRGQNKALSLDYCDVILSRALHHKNNILRVRVLKMLNRFLRQGPILQVWAKYMAPLDWLHLLAAFPDLAKDMPLSWLVKCKVQDCLQRYLGFTATTDTIVRHLETRAYALTGGFLLAVIAGDSLDAVNDIDIIHLGDPDNCPLTDCLPVTLQDHDSDDAASLYASSSLTQVSTFANKVQILHVSTATARQYVANFDLDFCKSYYNCVDGLVTDMSLHAISTRRSNLNLEHSHLLNPNSKATLLCTLRANKLLPVAARIRKYRQRGFNITVEPTAFASETELASALFPLYCATAATTVNRTSEEKWHDCLQIVREWNAFFAPLRTHQHQ